MNAATFTIGAEAANARNVAVQLGSRATAGATPKNVGSKRIVEMYLSSDAAGDTVVNAAGTGIVPTAGAAGKLLDPSVAAEQATFRMKTNALGLVNVILTNAGDENETVYLNAIMADNKVVTSGPIAFVDDTP